MFVQLCVLDMEFLFKFLLVVCVVLQCYKQLILEKWKKTAEKIH